MDEIEITILDDGTIKVTTNKVSAANHASADAFLREMARLAGGAHEVEHVKPQHVHAHTDQTLNQ
jgi:hypothetical protein